MKTNTGILVCLLLLAGMCIEITTGCRKSSHDNNDQPRGKYGYIFDDSTAKPISGVLIIGYRCDYFVEYDGCIGNSTEYDRTTTDTNGFFQLVYDPDAYDLYIMGYEIKKWDDKTNFYFVRHW